MKSVQHLISDNDGWLLSLWQTWDPAKLVPGRRPVAIVPGYGMNSFIFSYHPRGMSLEGFLVDAGFEVWRVDLRAQGGAVANGGTDNFTMADLALTDLTVTFDAIAERTHTGQGRVDVIGASLGGTLMFIHSVLRKEHRIATMVAMGSPVRWVKTHPLLKVLFASPGLAGAVKVRGVRKLAEVVLPLVGQHLPWLLSIYVNPAASDLSAARELVKTVENPNRFINREIAVWMASQDLFVQGVNIAERVKQLTAPLLCIVAGQDGIVPAETATWPYEVISSTKKQLVVVGDETMAMAHADLFIANAAHERVFRPISDWLAQNNAQAAPAAAS